MITKQDCYISSDGKIFLDEDKAKDWELNLIYDIIGPKLDKCAYDGLINPYNRMKILLTLFPDLESVEKFIASALKILNKEFYFPKSKLESFMAQGE